MKTTHFDRTPPSDDDLASKYTFDYKKAKSNRFAAVQDKEREMEVVVLDKDVAKVFSNPETVNKVPRALIETMP
jgi:hypothetical protein